MSAPKINEQPHAQTGIACSDLLAEIIAVLNESLNQWYPLRRVDGDDACDTRQKLYELRDTLERISANDQAHAQPD